jgi:hypothetical protein
MNAPAASPSLLSPTLSESSAESRKDMLNTEQLWQVFRTAGTLLACMLWPPFFVIAQGLASHGKGLQNVRMFSSTY